MASKEFAKSQIKRLSSTDFFPREPEAIAELVYAAMSAVSETACKATIDEFVRESTACPKPAEIRRVAYAKSEEERSLNPRPHCNVCGGTGFVSKVIKGYECAEECVCAARQKPVLVSRAG